MSPAPRIWDTATPVRAKKINQRGRRSPQSIRRLKDLAFASRECQWRLMESCTPCTHCTTGVPL
jgi:hypothetical protein